MAFDLLAALGFIHSKGVIHRDVKPANAMLTTVDGRLACKLIDFSIAAVAQESREEVRKPPRWPRSWVNFSLF